MTSPNPKNNSVVVGKLLNDHIVPVVTLPEPLLSGLIIRGSCVLSTSTALGYLFSIPVEELLISSPFAEEHGLLLYADAIRRLAKRRVYLKCLIREYHTNPQTQKAVRRLRDLYCSWGDSNRFQVREYHIQLNDISNTLPSTDDKLHYESTHAKLIIADNKACYVGSAELRMNSLFANFETGVIIQGQLVGVFREVFYHVWKASRAVYTPSN